MALKPKSSRLTPTGTPRARPKTKSGPSGRRGKRRAVKPIELPGGENVVLLSGGNPQIAKADGDAPVQAYIAAMPSWKRDVGKRLDALIVRTVPKVRKAVRWNSPFYGIEMRGGKDGMVSWFLGVHCLTKYIKLAFFSGTSLRPVPPVESRNKGTRYLHIHEGDWGGELDEKQLANWIRQASKLPGWVGFNC